MDQRDCMNCEKTFDVSSDDDREFCSECEAMPPFGLASPEEGGPNLD